MAPSPFVRKANAFVGNALGGVKGRANVAAWGVAGVLAYVLWIKPGREERKRQEEQAALARENDRFRYVEQSRPVSDPQSSSQTAVLEVADDCFTCKVGKAE